MPPTSRKQQRYVYAAAARGEKWAQRWKREGKMKVRYKGKRRSYR